MANSLKAELGHMGVRHIFCSKLTRAVQTAYYIALELGLPIILSQGFAQTAAAVTRVPDYEFLNISELQQLCPGTKVTAHCIPDKH